ncbi:MAG TPA: histidine kinase dimerization/phospho-acceptor domain-containing protein, partial [Casimicrobiaceae bacterium]|nr:histidine kinase dimerization/phospho-acceptor domain-containing protein [Casimicrobiaceae bacterium]
MTTAKLRLVESPATSAAQIADRALDWLATAVILQDHARRVIYANAAAEHLFALSRRSLAGRTLADLFGPCPALEAAIDKAIAGGASYSEQEIAFALPGGRALHLACTVTPVDAPAAALLLEFRHIDQALRVAREERLRDQQQANRELIRSLAHEIKNPLGGIRGAAQLLERAFPDQEHREYTCVIIREADRL